MHFFVLRGWVAILSQHTGLLWAGLAWGLAGVLDVAAEDAAVASVEGVVCIVAGQACEVTSYSHGADGVYGCG